MQPTLIFCIPPPFRISVFYLPAWIWSKISIHPSLSAWIYYHQISGSVAPWVEEVARGNNRWSEPANFAGCFKCGSRPENPIFGRLQPPPLLPAWGLVSSSLDLISCRKILARAGQRTACIDFKTIFQFMRRARDQVQGVPRIRKLGARTSNLLSLFLYWHLYLAI